MNARDDKDSDQDGLSDFAEINTYQTNHLNPDTDNGGINDGVEVYRGTDPNDRKDDSIDPRSDLGEGLYIIQEPCFSCPCTSSIEHSADLIIGDIVVGVITSKDDQQIFTSSQEVKIVAVPVNTTEINGE